MKNVLLSVLLLMISAITVNAQLPQVIRGGFGGGMGGPKFFTFFK